MRGLGHFIGKVSGLGLAAALGLSISTQAAGPDDIDLDLSEFLEDARDADRRELRDLETQVAAERREARQRKTSNEKRELKDAIETLKTQKSVFEKFQNDVRLVAPTAMESLANAFSGETPADSQNLDSFLAKYFEKTTIVPKQDSLANQRFKANLEGISSWSSSSGFSTKEFKEAAEKLLANPSDSSAKQKFAEKHRDLEEKIKGLSDFRVKQDMLSQMKVLAVESSNLSSQNAAPSLTDASGKWKSEGIAVGKNGLKMHLEISKNKEGSAKKYKIQYKFSLDPDAVKKIKGGKISKLTDEQIAEINKKLEEASGLGKAMEFNGADEAQKVLDQLKRNLDTAGKKDLRDDATALLKNLIDEYGDEKDSSSEIGKAHREYTYATSDASLVAKNFDNKLKIVEWLKNNSAKGKNSCEIMVAAIKWADLDSKTQQDCAEYNPEAKSKLAADIGKHLNSAKEKQEAEQKKSEAERAAERQAQQQKAAAMMAKVQGLQSFCEAFRRAEGLKASQQQTFGKIDMLKNALVKTGATSTIFVQHCKALTEGSDSASQILFGQEESGNEVNRAMTIAADFPNNEQGNLDLQREVADLQTIVSGAWSAMKQGESVTQAAMVDMPFVNTQALEQEAFARAEALRKTVDPNFANLPQEQKVKLLQSDVSGMLKNIGEEMGKGQEFSRLAAQNFSLLGNYYNCALTALRGTQAELNKRIANSGGPGGRFGTGSAANRDSVPVIGGGAGGASSAGRRQFGNQAPNPRPGQSGGNRTNDRQGGKARPDMMR